MSWCTVASGSHWNLYRYPAGGCVSTGVRWASSLTTSTPFSLPATVPGTSHFPLVHVSLPVNTSVTGTSGTYQLEGDIAALNAVRS